MEEKQIFATLEVSDHEVRMIVGEFFNTRFNILKVERVPVDALSYDTITDQDALTAAKELIRRGKDCCPMMEQIMEERMQEC